MRRGRSIGLTPLIVVLGAVGSRGADTPAASVLKAKGLARSGLTFVIEAEGPVLAKVKELRALFADYAAAAGRQAAAAQVATRLSELAERRAELQGGLDDLNQQINEQGFLQVNGTPRMGPGAAAARGAMPQMIARRDLIKATMAEVGAKEKALRAQAPPPGDRSALDEEVKTRAEACRSAVAELKPMVAEVAGKYAELGSDASVKAAIGELARASRANLRLGPSDAFKSGARALAEAERRLLGRPSASRPGKKGRDGK